MENCSISNVGAASGFRQWSAVVRRWHANLGNGVVYHRWAVDRRGMVHQRRREYGIVMVGHSQHVDVRIKLVII